jgi:hypothetical protein
MIVNNLLQKTDAELVGMLQAIDYDTANPTPVILAEMTRRAVVSLGETSQHIAASSRRLEKLTVWLIVLTIALGTVALPPTIELVSRLLR